MEIIAISFSLTWISLFSFKNQNVALGCSSLKYVITNTLLQKHHCDCWDCCPPGDKCCPLGHSWQFQSLFPSPPFENWTLSAGVRYSEICSTGLLHRFLYPGCQHSFRCIPVTMPSTLPTACKQGVQTALSLKWFLRYSISHSHITYNFTLGIFHELLNWLATLSLS